MKAKKRCVKIGNAQAFWGDTPTGPQRLVSQQADLDFLTLDYLSELSMSILAIQREKDPKGGYAKDFIDVIKSLIPFWQKGYPVKVVTNAGGLNPVECALECRRALQAAGLIDMQVGAVDGDDVLDLLKSDLNAQGFNHLDTQEPLSFIAHELVTANAYLGAWPIVELLKQGMHIVITGRIADPSLTVAPAVYYHGWQLDDYDKLAQATVAGHLIECGTQVTGGVISDNWLSIDNPAHLGFPIVEIFANSAFIITKPANTAGMVTMQTVKEQLLYEIGDPKAYLSPDVSVSFLTLKLKEQSKDRIEVSGATGKAPPNFYKVSATYRKGYKAEGMLVVFGPDAIEKAKRCGHMIFQRVAMSGFELQKTLVECLGTGDSIGKVAPVLCDLECVLRVAAADERKEALEVFVKEIAPLVTSGPQGVTGYTSGRPKVRPQFGYWPCLIEQSKVVAKVRILTDKEL